MRYDWALRYLVFDVLGHLPTDIMAVVCISRANQILTFKGYATRALEKHVIKYLIITRFKAKWTISFGLDTWAQWVAHIDAYELMFG